MKSVVLLSGGLDSTVNLHEAHRQGQVLLVLTFDYGQRAAQKEIDISQAICRKLGLLHQVIRLDFFKQFGQSSLLDKSQNIPTGGQVQIDDLKTSQATAKSVWVPNRNGIFLNIGAGFAEALNAETVVPGFNAEEATTFADNSTEYLQALTRSFSYSTRNKIQAHCFTDRLTKTELVARGKELGVDFSLIWPCYHSGEKWCGQCESCQRAKRALEKNQIQWSGL
ncbi:MAG: 7-cyano-7-deazaguanine synthase [Oligoflexia bacterium]|nr:MAG: 7-cyano-7-deazaguanine synthase [Oligoflexia bacterium]